MDARGLADHAVRGALLGVVTPPLRAQRQGARARARGERGYRHRRPRGYGPRARTPPFGFAGWARAGHARGRGWTAPRRGVRAGDARGALTHLFAAAARAPPLVRLRARGA